MRKIVLTYGLIAGTILSVMMLLTLPFHDTIGFDRFAVIGYTTMVLAFLMIYFGIRAYRDSAAGGRISFGRGLQVGLSIMAVASACYVATWQVIYHKLAPDFMEKYTAYTIEAARQDGASEAELAEKSREMAKFGEMYKNPLVNIAFTFLEPLPVGLLFSLVSAGLLSRKRREDAVAMPSAAGG
jgi:amino acid transporter